MRGGEKPADAAMSLDDTARELCPFWFASHLDFRPEAQRRADHEKVMARLRLACGRKYIAELRAQGFRLWIDAGTPKINGAPLTAEAAAVLKRAREEIVLALEAEARPAAG